MLMPALSVTAIGIVVAAAAMIVRRPARVPFIRAFVGAWLGFIAGAIPGIIIDVTTGSGSYVAVVGHVGPALGAFLAATRDGGSAATIR